ncbi:hypothetical protein ACFE04_028217 [Oxalis oulophora]
MALLQNGRNAIRHIVNKEPNLISSSSDRIMNPLLYACQGIRYRKLQVILTTNVQKLGKAGETVKVAPGYFRNHLMPRLLAVPNIDKFAYLIKEQRKIYQPAEEEEMIVAVKKTSGDSTKEYEKAARRLENAKVVLKRQISKEKLRARASKDDPIALYSPVTKEDIVAEVARQLCVDIEPENLQLSTPLSTVGEFEIPLRLPRSIPLPEGKVNWTLDVKIRCR